MTITRRNAQSFIAPSSLPTSRRPPQHRPQAHCTARAEQTGTISRRAALQLLALTISAQSVPHAAQSAVRVADPDAGSRIFTTASGLRYYDFITPGEGSAQVAEGERVTVHYTLGTTGARNGWRIDSSFDRDPLSFTVGKGEVVRGLDEGVLGMRMGGKRRIIIPSELGYKTKDDRPVVMGFAEWQRFKNIYLNPNRAYKPDLVMDVTMVRVGNRRAIG